MRLRYRLVLYGDRHGSRDFDTLTQLLGFLNTAGVAVNVNEISLSDSQTPSILVSQTIELSDSEVSGLGLGQPS